MDVAIIDWKGSKFVKDDTLENINAPQWVDLSAPDAYVDDDEAWFCRRDCSHPKTIDDYHRVTPTSKLQKPASVSDILPLGDRNRRDAALKNRGLTRPSISLNKESESDRLENDGENQNPNLSTPTKHKAKFIKEAVTSITEEKEVENLLPKEETPKLKSTLSARNLFTGRDILNQITDFWVELKRMAVRTKERAYVAKEYANKSSEDLKEQEVMECSCNNSSVLDERKPLLEEREEKHKAMDRSNAKEKLRKKRINDGVNTPILVNLKNKRRKEWKVSKI